LSKMSSTFIVQISSAVFLSCFILGTLAYSGLELLRGQPVPAWAVTVLTSAITFSVHALGVGNGVSVANGTAKEAVSNLIAAQTAGPAAAPTQQPTPAPVQSDPTTKVNSLTGDPQ